MPDVTFRSMDFVSVSFQQFHLNDKFQIQFSIITAVIRMSYLFFLVTVSRLSPALVCVRPYAYGSFGGTSPYITYIDFLVHYLAYSIRAVVFERSGLK